MEALCIETSELGTVIAGNTYNVSESKLCKCAEFIVHGIPINPRQYSLGVPKMGDTVICEECGCTYSYDGTVRVLKKYFGLIGEEDECEQYSKKEELVEVE